MPSSIITEGFPCHCSNRGRTSPHTPFREKDTPEGFAFARQDRDEPARQNSALPGQAAESPTILTVRRFLRCYRPRMPMRVKAKS